MHSRSSAFWSVIVVAVLTCGCSTIGGLPPDDIQNVLTKAERETLSKRAVCIAPCLTPIFAARLELELLVDELPALGETRVKASQSFGELTFWGALTSVIGAVTKHNAVLNIGAGTAAFGSVVPQHYKTEGFVAAFDRAETRSKCLRDAVRGADDVMLATVSESQTAGTPAVAEVVRDVKENLLSTVNDIRVLLSSELRHNRPDATISGTAIFEAFQKAAKASTQAASLNPSAAKAQPDAAMSRDELLKQNAFAKVASLVNSAPAPRPPVSKELLQDYTDRLALLSGSMKSCLK